MDADVLVIGAGAAGLAAARDLAARSLRVVVLEARDRFGGRVWSISPGRSAVPAELGAEFIHGTAAETMALLRETGGATVDTAGESWLAGDDGCLRRDDGGFRSAPGIFEGARALVADESVDRFLRRFADDATMQDTVEAARAFVEGFDAADPAIASALAIADEWASGVDSVSARPLGGYRPIFERLHDAAAGAGAALSLSTVVRQISWRRGAVAVAAETSPGESREFRARTAIVTLPVGVLRHRGDESEIAFDPNLPFAKTAALERIEMGHVVKVVLRFRTAFWERLHDGRYRDAAFFRAAGLPFAAYWTQYPVRNASITAWAGGTKATALRGTSTRELIALALDGLGALLEEPAVVREEFDTGTMHDWSSDPFARGAYSYVAVGGGNARAELAAPLDDTLFFAGEATSSDGQGGTVNGAIETGERAARELAASIGMRG